MYKELLYPVCVMSCSGGPAVISCLAVTAREVIGKPHRVIRFESVGEKVPFYLDQ